MKLKLKPTILSYQVSGMVVLRVLGEYAKIPDSSGAMWLLTNYLDGSRTADQIVAEVRDKYPDMPGEELQAVIGDFIKHKMVEVPDEDLETYLDETTLQRFSRNFDFFGSLTPFGQSKFSYQEKLNEKKVCVLGCGGLGTHILLDLAAIGVKNLTIVDFDRIELSNLNRQILYRESDIGKEKVETAKQRLLEFNASLNITTHDIKLDSADSVRSIIFGHDIVICVADKPANYMVDWINSACISCRIPFITGGLSVRRSLFYSVDPGKSGCANCWWQAARKKNKIFDTISPLNKEHDITYAKPAPAFVTLVAVTAGMMVSEAVKYLTGCQEPSLTNKLKEFSFDELSVNVTETWEKNLSCEVCGGMSSDLI